ncbi:MAG: hypothetical protein WBK55_08645 [Alphaproteobacteria bacterium]
MKLAARKTQNNSSARVVDGKLILSYPEALTPIVWQMDLSQAKASALEVRETPKGISLVLKTAKGETAEIAPFATKEEAVAALMAAARALENAHGHMRTGGVANNDGAGMASSSQAKNPRSRLAAGALGVLLVLVLLMIWGTLAPRPPISVEGRGTALAPGQSGAAGQDQNGVPLSADEFLMKQRMQ